MATLVGAALVSFAAPGYSFRMQYALALAVVCALLFFIFWIFRLAFLANFLSRAVMAGFITGLGIEVFTNQVRKKSPPPTWPTPQRACSRRRSSSRRHWRRP